MTKILQPNFKPSLTEDQKACVEVLKEALAQALEGEFYSVGVVVCMKDGFSHAMAGRRAADLYMACGSMQRDILDKTSKAGAATLQGLVS